MSLTPAVLDAMVASGCTAEQIAAAVKASMMEADEKINVRRAKDRERKRRQRAENKEGASEMSRGQGGTGADKVGQHVTPPSLSPNDNISNPHTHPLEHKTRAREVPEDFWPEVNPKTKTGERMAQWDRGRLEAEVEKFIAHHQAKGNKFKDWQRAWTTWALSNFQKEEIGNGGNSRPERASARDIGERLASRLASGGDSPIDLVPRLGSASGHDREGNRGLVGCGSA